MNHRIASQAVVIATGIFATGHREILGLMVGDSESKPFWTKFLRSLRARGLENVQLVISDSRSGLVAELPRGPAFMPATSCHHPIETPVRRPPLKIGTTTATETVFEICCVSLLRRSLSLR